MSPYTQDDVTYVYEQTAPGMTNAQAALIAATITCGSRTRSSVKETAHDYLRWLNWADKQDE